jgi:hypothetical protein
MKRQDIKHLKLVGAILETVLAIPILGGLIIISTLWTMLLITLGFHIAILAISSNNKARKTAPILGIVTSCLGWIPIVGWIMHVITAVFYWIDWTRKKV